MSRAALAALVAAFLVLETALRCIGYSAPQWYELDPQLGWRLHPHRHGWFVADGKRVPVHTTPSGFRDRREGPPVLRARCARRAAHRRFVRARAFVRQPHADALPARRGDRRPFA